MPVWVILLVAMLAALIAAIVSGCGLTTYDKSVGFCSFEQHGIHVELYEDYNSSQIDAHIADPGFKGLCDNVKKWRDWTKTDVEINHG
jgi:hypothetical protein